MSYEGVPPRQGGISIPLPIQQPVQAGDFVARITRALGAKQCGGCKRRQEWLNRHLRFVPIR